MQKIWHRLPFVGRLLLTSGIALLVAGSIMTLIAAREAARDIRTDIRHILDRELETLPGMLAEAVVIGDFAALQQMLDRYTARPMVTEVQFRDIKGITLISKDAPVADGAPAWFLKLFEHEDARGVASVNVGGREYGQLHLTIASHPLANRAWTHLLNQMTILLLAVAINFIGIWVILHLGLRPLRHLTDGARAMAAGQLDLHLKPAGSPEVREAIEAFNRMAAAIDANHRKPMQSAQQLRQDTRQWHEQFALETTANHGTAESCNTAHLPAFPLSQPIPMAVEPEDAPARLSGRILVVEDNPTNRKVAAAMLDRLGLQVVLAENGQQGVDAAMCQPGPDLILMDIQMPIMDGRTATRQIRAREAAESRARIPIIALTADAYEKDRKAAMEAGMDDFMAKPIDLNTLTQMLERWLGADRNTTLPPTPSSGSAPLDAEPAHPVFDETRMLEQIGGERTIARMMLQSAMQDMPVYLDKLEQVLQKADWKEVQRVVHTMKGLMFQIGALRLAEQLKAADLCLKKGERIKLDQADRWRDELANLIFNLKNWLD